MNIQDDLQLLHMLWVLPVFLGCIGVAAYRRRRLLAQSFPDPGEREIACAEVSVVRRRIRWGLIGVMLACAGIAISRPQYGHSELGITSDGGDVVVVLDVSRSMYARDVTPDRLTIAKNLIYDLIASLPDHRFSLIVFAGKAYTACPMTSSRTSLKMIIDDVSPATMPYGGTNVEEALNECLASVRGAETGKQAVILISDGDIQQGAPDQVLPAITTEGLPVFTVGVGKPGSNALVQLPDTTFVRFNGAPVRTSLDPAVLQSLSARSGGTYWQASDEPVLAERMASTIRSQVVSESAESQISRPTERYQWPLALGFLSFAIAIVVTDKPARSARALVTMVVAIASLTAGAAEVMPADVSEIKDRVEGEVRPENRIALQYQLAVALHRAQVLDKAIDHYKQIIISNHAEESMRGAAMHNLAVIYFQRGTESMDESPAEAIDLFNKVVVLSRSSLEVTFNEAVVKLYELAGIKRQEAEERYRELQKKRQLKSEAINKLKKAADAQQAANKSQSLDDQANATKQTEKAEEHSAQLNDQTLDEMIDKAREAQNKLARTDGPETRESLGQEALEHLVNALAHLGIKQRKPDDKQTKAASPPDKLPKDQSFEEVKDKKKRALMILRAMRKEEEMQRKEIRDMKKRAFRARVGEERDW